MMPCREFDVEHVKAAELKSAASDVGTVGTHGPNMSRVGLRRLKHEAGYADTRHLEWLTCPGH
jgi:hypothetical protein